MESMLGLLHFLRLPLPVYYAMRCWLDDVHKVQRNLRTLYGQRRRSLLLDHGRRLLHDLCHMDLQLYLDVRLRLLRIVLRLQSREVNRLSLYSKHNHKWRVFEKIYNNLGQLEGRHVLWQDRVCTSGQGPDALR